MSSALHTHCGHLQEGPTGGSGEGGWRGGGRGRGGGRTKTEDVFHNLHVQAAVLQTDHRKGLQGEGGGESALHGTQAATQLMDCRNEGVQQKAGTTVKGAVRGGRRRVG